MYISPLKTNEVSGYLARSNVALYTHFGWFLSRSEPVDRGAACVNQRTGSTRLTRKRSFV